MKFKALLSLLSAVLIIVSTFANAETLYAGKVTQVTLHDLIPTQPSIGYDQVYYKLGRYKLDSKKKFDEICEANGQKGLAHFDTNSTSNDATSYQCDEPVGSRLKDMKTIVIAPNGHYYLTDGHHTFNAFWHMQGGGEQFKINVVVAKDYRNLTNMSQFWSAMVADGNTWLQNSKGNTISYKALPTSLGMEHFENDKYRSLMYFSRDIAWDKPAAPVPFLEFYWSRELRKDIDLDKYDLTTKEGYRQAVSDVSHYLVAMKSDNVGGSGKSTKEMGQFDSFDEKNLNKLFDAKKGKATFMLQYKDNL